MRNRLTLWLVGAVLMTGLLIGIPLVLWADYGLTHESQEVAQASADRTVELLDARVDQTLSNNPEDVGPYLTENRQIRVTSLADGATDVYGEAPTGRYVTASATGRYFTVEVDEPLPGSSARIGLRIVATMLVAVGIACLVSRRWSRRLADAMEELAIDAERIGLGDTRPARRHGMAELDQVAQALDASSQRVHDLVKVERAFTSNVTHQLRTPLTAISLRLDEVAVAEDLETAREEAAAAQEQVERLADVIADLHRAAVQREVEREVFALDQVLQRQCDEWRPVFKAQGRELVEPATTGVLVVGAPGALGQVIATLLDNASVHGAGAVTVGIRVAEGSVVIEVADEGAGIPPELGTRAFDRSVSGEPSGSGLGLSLARALAEHMGGRLELVSARPAVFAIFLERMNPAQGGEPVGGAMSRSNGGQDVRDASASADSS